MDRAEVRAWLETSLIESYEDMHRTARRIFPNAHEADEIVQDAAVRATRYLLGLLEVTEEEREAKWPRKPRPWLCRITFNLARDRWRRIHSRPRVIQDGEGMLEQAPSGGPSPVDDLLAREGGIDPDVLRAAILELSTGQALTVMTYYELILELGRRPSFAEVGERLNLTEGAAKLRFQRAKAKLIPKLKRLGIELGAKS